MMGERLKEKLAIRLAWLLPRRVAMWCAYRVGANATQGRWGHESPTDLLFMTAMDRWDAVPQPRAPLNASSRSREADKPDPTTQTEAG